MSSLYLCRFFFHKLVLARRKEFIFFKKNLTCARAHRGGKFAIKVKEWRKKGFNEGGGKGSSVPQTGSSQY